MADQHNSNIPALPNQVAEDIPDIKENLEFHKDAFERIIETWSDSDNSSAKLDTVPGFNDGTYNYEFPTNGVAGHSVIMLGDSDTIVWMYLNAAPPGWKVTATGADTVLAVAGGAAAYNDDGGKAGGSFSILTANIEAHSHTLTVQGNTAGANTTYVTHGGTTSGTATPSTSNAGGADGLYRPKGSLGKLYQLDTA